MWWEIALLSCARFLHFSMFLLRSVCGLIGCHIAPFGLNTAGNVSALASANLVRCRVGGCFIARARTMTTDHAIIRSRSLCSQVRARLLCSRPLNPHPYLVVPDCAGEELRRFHLSDNATCRIHSDFSGGSIQVFIGNQVRRFEWRTEITSGESHDNHANQPAYLHAETPGEQEPGLSGPCIPEPFGSSRS